MKNILLILTSGLFLLSCNKQLVDLDKSTADSNLLSEQTSIINSLSNSDLPHDCWDDWSNGMTNFESRPGYPLYTFTQIMDTTSTYYHALNGCYTNFYQNLKSLPLEAVTPQPNFPPPIEANITVTAYNLFSMLTNTFAGNGVSSLYALKVAYNHAYQNHKTENLSLPERSTLVIKSIHQLGYSDMYIYPTFHYVPSFALAMHYVPRFISGEFPMTENAYNTFIANNPSQNISYPITQYVGWMKIVENADVPTELTETPPQININYNTYMFYVNSIEDLYVDLTLAPLRGSNVFPHNGKLYSDISHTTFIPDAVYKISDDHPILYEKNNYALKVINGVIISQIGK